MLLLIQKPIIDTIVYRVAGLFRDRATLRALGTAGASQTSEYTLSLLSDAGFLQCSQLLSCKWAPPFLYKSHDFNDCSCNIE